MELIHEIQNLTAPQYVLYGAAMLCAYIGIVSGNDKWFAATLVIGTSTALF